MERLSKIFGSLVFNDNVMKIVNCIEEVNSKNLTLDEKYEKLKVYFELIKYFDRNIAIYILELITLVIQ